MTVKIRYREIMNRSLSGYDRFGEYQVWQGRKILFRADFRKQAEQWAKEHGYEVVS